jgi:hypothetical protein
MFETPSCGLENTSSHTFYNQIVDHITKKGAYAMIVPHNYGRYYKTVITDVAGFQAYWKTVATAFKSNSKVIFDTNNECECALLSIIAFSNKQRLTTGTGRSHNGPKPRRPPQPSSHKRNPRGRRYNAVDHTRRKLLVWGTLMDKHQWPNDGVSQRSTK